MSRRPRRSACRLADRPPDSGEPPVRNPTAPARAELVGVAERLSWLPLVLEAVELERLERPLPAARATTVVRLRGGGEEGLGEDVTFQAADMLSRAPDPEPMRAVSTLGGLWGW